MAPGFIAAAMMAINNYRDLTGDSNAGKRTLAVLLGSDRAAKLPGAFIWAGFLTVFVYGLFHHGLVACLPLVPIGLVVRFGIEPLILGGKTSLNTGLKIVSLLNLVFGILVFIWSF